MSIRKIATAILLIFLIITPRVYAAASEQNPMSGIRQSAVAAWNAFTEFLGETWNDARHLWISFFSTLSDDIGKILALIISICGWLWKFVPESLKRFLMAIAELFIRLIHLGIDFLKGILSVFAPHNTTK